MYSVNIIFLPVSLIARDSIFHMLICYLCILFSEMVHHVFHLKLIVCIFAIALKVLFIYLDMRTFSAMGFVNIFCSLQLIKITYQHFSLFFFIFKWELFILIGRYCYFLLHIRVLCSRTVHQVLVGPKDFLWYFIFHMNYFNRLWFIFESFDVFIIIFI